jgi:two-component system, OmpR family, sensor histidine kinase PhoQ
LDNQVAAATALAADENDLMELLGNLLDNACKYARTRVVVRGELGADGWLWLTVEDDGPGIAEGMVERALARGAGRATPGAGDRLGGGTHHRLPVQGADADWP